MGLKLFGAQLLIILFFFTVANINSQAYGQDSGKSNLVDSSKNQGVYKPETKKSVAYVSQCAPILDEIARLKESLKDIIKELESLQPPKRWSSESDEQYASRVDSFQQRLKQLEERFYEVEDKIKKKKFEYERCKHKSESSLKEDKEFQAMDKSLQKQSLKARRLIKSHKKSIKVIQVKPANKYYYK
jgi:uncharacterized protein YukE